MSQHAKMAPADVNESSKDITGVPSGFILKLYQMVNGAPDEVISVSEVKNKRSFERKKSINPFDDAAHCDEGRGRDSIFPP
jgi:hypothetical protein